MLLSQLRKRASFTLGATIFGAQGCNLNSIYRENPDNSFDPCVDRRFWRRPFARGETKPAAETASRCQPLSQDQIDFFEKKIRPVLSEKCYKCHAEKSEKIKGG